MREYIAEYIVPVEKKGNDCMFDFMNAKPPIRCNDCYFCDTFQRKPYCTKYDHSTKKDGYCAWPEPKETE